MSSAPAGLKVVVAQVVPLHREKFPPLKKGGQGGFEGALEEIPLDPPFSKGEETPPRSPFFKGGGDPPKPSFTLPKDALYVQP
jgi:hypothetical protein